MIITVSRLSRRLLLAAVAATVLAGCTSTPAGHPDDRASASASPAPATTPAPAPTPTVKPTGAADPALQPFYGQQISWAQCADDPATKKADESAAQCGKLRVPLDYANPAADTVEVEVARFPAGKPDQRLGSLLVNPGGPGGSGVTMVTSDPEGWAGPLRDRFDIVGFDPRGVRQTAPVRCLDDTARDAWNETDDQGAAHGKVLADACQANSGKVLPFVGTRNSARDMDVLRAVLGDQKLNYLGFSYGTYLGSLYAEEFPDRTGRLVLDGAVDPTMDLLQLNVQQQAGFEKSLNDFAADCVKHDGCSLGRDPARAAQKLADFLDGLKDKPLVTGNGRKLTASEGWTAVLSSLYGSEKGWENLRNVIAWAMVKGKGDYLLQAADNYNGRDAQGHYGNTLDAYLAIHCADGGVDTPTPEKLQATVAELREKAPLVSKHNPEQALFDPDCRAWTYRSTEQPHQIKATGSAPILVVGSTGDPATPYAWSQKLATGLANGVLLTREGEGHTGYGKSTCISTAVNGFLTGGAMPAAGTTCPSG
ncbi:proteinase [Kitasatospora indigofera]|uniref:Proteinase n=1 Tax=Kitasatospora indigofera TaxID=67307 RepID=A0A919L160_9ACTN|nr:alpha/beta hydrolase [Kitasatospora indigofera]GHH81040.1 proteinase [Kitasatospora indigofera]